MALCDEGLARLYFQPLRTHRFLVLEPRRQFAVGEHIEDALDTGWQRKHVRSINTMHANVSLRLKTKTLAEKLCRLRFTLQKGGATVTLVTLIPVLGGEGASERT